MNLSHRQLVDAQPLQTALQAPEDTVTPIVKIDGIIANFGGDLKDPRMVGQCCPQQDFTLAVERRGINVVDAQVGGLVHHRCRAFSIGGRSSAHQVGPPQADCTDL